MPTQEKTRSKPKRPAKGPSKEHVVLRGQVVEGRVINKEASVPRKVETPRPTDLHPQTLQRLDPLTKTYQTAGMRAEEARQRALNELREAESKGELP